MVLDERHAPNCNLRFGGYLCSCGGSATGPQGTDGRAWNSAMAEKEAQPEPSGGHSQRCVEAMQANRKEARDEGYRAGLHEAGKRLVEAREEGIERGLHLAREDRESGEGAAYKRGVSDAINALRTAHDVAIRALRPDGER